MNRARVVLLTRQGCTLCERTAARLAELADELGFDLTTTDVDAAAAAGDPALRAEFVTGCRWYFSTEGAQLLGARRAQAAGRSCESDRPSSKFGVEPIWQTATLMTW